MIVIAWALHWVADFVCQSHWIATKKSSNVGVLALHVLIYTLCITLGIAIVQGLTAGISEWQVVAFAGATFTTHLVTDFFTSRATSRLWAAQQWHDFFVLVGLDQLIHFTTLWCTLYYLDMLDFVA